MNLPLPNSCKDFPSASSAIVCAISYHKTTHRSSISPRTICDVNPIPSYAAYTSQMVKRLILLAFLCAGLAAAHPMGNFSVNHYARLEPDAHGVAIRYVMDLAEIPTFEMFQQWGSGADPQREGVRAGARVGGQPGDHGQRPSRPCSRGARARSRWRRARATCRWRASRRTCRWTPRPARSPTKIAITRGGAGGRRSSVPAARIAAPP